MDWHLYGPLLRRRASPAFTERNKIEPHCTPNFSTGNSIRTKILLTVGHWNLNSIFYLRSTLTKDPLTEVKTEKYKSRKYYNAQKPRENKTAVWHPIPDQTKYMGGGHP